MLSPSVYLRQLSFSMSSRREMLFLGLVCMISVLVQCNSSKESLELFRAMQVAYIVLCNILTTFECIVLCYLKFYSMFT